jgi:hypothetical protein
MVKNSTILNSFFFLCLLSGALSTSAQAPRIIEVSDELPCNATPTIFIGNIIRRMTVLTTTENKVRLVTTVAVEGNCRYSNSDWLQTLELKVSGSTNNLNVKSGNMWPEFDRYSKNLNSFSPSSGPPHRTPDLPRRQPPNKDLTPSGTVVFDNNGRWQYKKGNIRRNIFLYVPVGSKLEIDSRYAEILLDSNIREVNARITNGTMSMKDAGRLTLINNYSSVYAANIGQADVQLNHGWFHAKDISALDINSKVSTVELGALGKIRINSNDDQYELEEAGDISGGKNYGSIRINTLKHSLDLTGVNADIKVHNIEPGVSTVKIDGRYADLRLPVDNLRDYTVNFEGRGTNLYTPFQRVHVTDTSFNVTIGSGKKHSFLLKCSNCTLDMK